MVVSLGNGASLSHFFRLNLGVRIRISDTPVTQPARPFLPWALEDLLLEDWEACSSSQGLSWRRTRNGIPLTATSGYSVQFSSVTQSCLTLCDPINRRTPGLPVHHQLREFTQTHVHRVSDAIQPSHPLSSPSPPAPNPSQHQSLFQ